MDDLKALAGQLERSFPQITPVGPLVVLGEGFSSLVVETQAGTVFRIAKNQLAQQGHRREWNTLSIVRRHVSGFSLPKPEHYLCQSEDFPYGLIGYKKVPGRPLAPEDITLECQEGIAQQVAEFLVALHRVPLDVLNGLELPRYPPMPLGLDDMWQRTSGYLGTHLSHDEFEHISAWWRDVLHYDQLYSYSPTLVHGDLWYENILYDPNRRRIVGVIDFENLSFGDPVIDLATQSYLGASFTSAVLRHYYAHKKPPANLSERVRKLLGLRELMGLKYGLLVNEVDADTLDKIRAAAI